MKNKKALFVSFICLITISMFSQEDEPKQSSNIQTYTPSKLLNKGSCIIGQMFDKFEMTFLDSISRKERIFVY